MSWSQANDIEHRVGMISRASIEEFSTIADHYSRLAATSDRSDVRRAPARAIVDGLFQTLGPIAALDRMTLSTDEERRARDDADRRVDILADAVSRYGAPWPE